MIWLVSKEVEQYRHLLNSLLYHKLPVREFHHLTEVMGILDQRPQAIIIDIDDIEGLSFEFCWMVTHNMRSSKISILFFSSSSEENLEVSAFNSGASDFIQKPFRPSAVIKRIAARLNSLNENSVLRIKTGTESFLEINKEEFSVTYNNEDVVLSKKEFELLYELAAHPGKVFSRFELYKKVWNGVFDSKDRTIDVHILRLRKKLEDSIISTLKGVGYRLNPKL